jgi:DNA primase
MMFPQPFIDDVRAQADIVQVIQDYVSLKRAGATYKGLCPFHSEKTPSFHVNRDKGFFHCFGCGAGGDVFKFLQMQEQLSFPEAVAQLAQRLGLSLPERESGGDQARDNAEREALLKIHEIAAAYFREQLAAPAGARARQQLSGRGMTPALIDALGIGYAPPARDAIKGRLLQQGFPLPLALRSGLVVERDGGETVDRFRGRIMIPICRDTGSVIAFGGRAMEAEQQPKYLNSPETPIYSKGRTLYGLHLTKSEIRRVRYAVLVEGYFDFAQVLGAGIGAVVASCGTALTQAQAHLLRRFTSKVILSFDPDAAGQGAAVRSCEMLVAEGFDVNVAVLPAGEDPDTFVRRQGGEGYVGLLKQSRPYLEFLLDRASAEHDLGTDEGRRHFLEAMLAVAARIPEPAARDQFADRLAHKARITEEVVRAEIRRAAVSRQTQVTERELPGLGQMRHAERGLLWWLVHEPQAGLLALGELEDEDFRPLATRRMLEMARSLQSAVESEALPSALLERLKEIDAQLVARVATEPTAPAPAAECARALRRVRFEREQAAVQREIDRLQGLGASQHDREINTLWERKKDLRLQIEALT